MKETISDLWNGRLSPCDGCGIHDPQVKELSCWMGRCRDALIATMTPPQKQLLEAYMDCSEDHLLRMMEDAFCQGFSLASSLLTEALFFA